MGMTRGDMIEVAARALVKGKVERVARTNPPQIKTVYLMSYLEACQIAPGVIDALIAAGVIPAEGAVTVERSRWNRVAEAASAAADAITEDDRGMLYWTCTADELYEFVGLLQPGDLDAIPDTTTPEDCSPGVSS